MNESFQENVETLRRPKTLGLASAPFFQLIIHYELKHSAVTGSNYGHRLHIYIHTHTQTNKQRTNIEKF